MRPGHAQTPRQTLRQEHCRGGTADIAATNQTLKKNKVNKKQRDNQLDAYRGLIMIHMVCVIHVLYCIGPKIEPLSSVLLFEMPAVFFISGAAQSRRESPFPPILTYIAGRAKRVLVPFFLFIPLLLFGFAAVSFAGLSVGNYVFDASSLTAGDVVKLLLTGGNAKIPTYQYTWFISCYFALLCSFPIQRRLLRHIPRTLYLSLNLVAIAAMSFIDLGFHQGYLVKNLVIYNFFFLAGYFYYRRFSLRHLVAVAAVTVPIAVFTFISGTAVPMQQHKFPPDICFLAFGMAWLSVLSLLLWKAKLPECRMINVWNERGYNIFLYQVFSLWTVVFITSPWIDSLDNTWIRLTVLSLLTFAVTTVLSHFTFAYEQAAIKFVLRNK